MRRLIALLLLAAAVVSAQQVPRKATDFAIGMPDAKPQLLSSYKGKTIVFAFMFTTCTHCQHTAGVLAAIQKEYAGKGVQVLGATVNEGAAFSVKDFNRVFGVNFPCGYADETSMRKFLGLGPDEPYFVPVLVFIDKDFMIRSQYIGDEQFLNKQEVNIRAEIDRLLK